MAIGKKGLTEYIPPLLLAGLLLCLPLVYWEVLKNGSSLPRYILIGLSAGLLLLYWVVLNFRKHSLVWHRLFLMMMLFALWAIFSINWSVDPSNTYNTSLQLISFILISFYAAQVGNTESKATLIIYAMVAGGVFVAIIGIQQAYGMNIFNYRQSAPPASTFINRNFAAIYIDTITPLAFIAILITSHTRMRWLFACCFSVVLSYQIITTSRGSWLAILVFLAVFIYFLLRNTEIRSTLRSRLRSSRIQLTAASLLVILIIWTPLQQSPSMESKLSGQATSSISLRLNANINAIGLLVDQPITGVGYGAFMLGFRPYMFKYVPIKEVSEYKYLLNLHNAPLQLFVELGIPGGILALGIYIWILLLALRIIRSGKSGNVRILGMGILLSLLSFGVHALVSFPLNKPTSALMFWVLIGLTIGLYSKSSEPRRPQYQLPKTILAGVAVFALFFLAINIRHYIHYYSNHLYYQILEKKFVAEDCDAALKILEHIDFRTVLTLRVYYPMVYGNCNPGAEELLAKMNQVINYDPNNTLARIVRGKHHLETQQPKLAADDFLVVIAILPHKAIGYLGLGNAATQEGKYTFARNLYRKALEIEPNNETALVMLSRLEENPQ